jgi:hypothetical protein
MSGLAVPNDLSELCSFETVNSSKVVLMKRAVVTCAAVVAICLLVIPLVRGQGVPDRPQGVAAGAWIPLNARLGFVVAPPATDKPLPKGAGNALLLAPPVAGFFMIKGETGWSRVVIVEPLRGPGAAG